MLELIESDYNEKEIGCEIIKYLEKELRIKKQILLYENSNPKKTENSKRTMQIIRDVKNASFVKKLTTYQQ